MVATIFTTTSVPDFNEMFQSVLQQIQAVHLQDAIGLNYQVNILGGTSPLRNTKQSVNWIFEYTLVAFRKLVQNGTWDKHVTASPGKSTLTNTATQPVPITADSEHYNDKIRCFNCDGVEGLDVHHHLQNFPFPRDQQRIKANREKKQPSKFQDYKNKLRHKWRPPEASEGGKRTIDGKPMSWNSATKRWDEVETPPSGLPSDTGAIAGTAPTLPLIPQPTNAKEQIRLQMLA